MFANRLHLACQILVAVVLLCHAPLSGQSINVPFLAGRVNDTAGMLSPQTIVDLEALLKAHEDTTSNQVVVLTIPSLQGAVLEDYSMKVAETWKLGQADKDNGVLLLVARDDRKVRIEVGSRLEGNLPDITCARIIRNEIVPRFRDGNFDAGIRNGVKAILLAIEGSYAADSSEASKSDSMARKAVIIFVVGVLIIGLFVLVLSSQGGRPSLSRKAKRLQKNRVASSRSGWPFHEQPLFWWAVAVGSAPSSDDYSGDRRKQRRSKSSRRVESDRSSDASSGGGSSWGSDSSSNDSSGGDFSGDGGDFSGGGASGKW